ncbi:O-antigen ligase family protein [Hymenobacter arizonensis]|uniref:O-antigen ligase n=1 Tax=Hymenobacter arizonensis TaxID=1227077 RepID=A0A1I5SHJ2_HYMAR|nr:O-antigen ligase family protein [Hymenobacter arizonensis]SFP70195.1 O-antigen ligase [Hymenobacter arizonensis]
MNPSVNELLHRLRRSFDGAKLLFTGFVLVLLASGVAAAQQQQPVLLLPGLLAVGALVALVEWRWLYYLLFLLLPFTQEIGLVGNMRIDLPSEPLMLALTACVGMALLLRNGQLPLREWTHPLVVIPGLMFLWTAVGITCSVDKVKSFKYLLAKTWYIMPFLIGTLLVIRRPSETWRFVAVYVAGACLSVFYVAVRHAANDFSFQTVNGAVHPFFRNHVIYSTMLALLVPFGWLGMQAARKGSARLAWQLGLGVLLFGLLTSYTRASLLSLPIAGLFYLIIRLRLTRTVLATATVTLALAVSYIASGDNYKAFAPNYERITFNGDNFGKHLTATYNLQDVSGMERIYRWVAAARMVAEKPLMGSGAATFYPEYKRYTLKSFRTFLSDNPEKSTAHNYFLLQLAEQGVPGFLLFVSLVFTALLRAESLYHRARQQPEVRRVVLAAALSFVIIVFHLTLNELVEVDRIGSIFFLCLALLVRAESWLAVSEAAANPT